MRPFISYHSRDQALVERIVAGFAERRPGWKPFFAQQSLASGYWMPQLAKSVADADAFLFVFGERLGPWQKIEYYCAFDRRAQEPNLPIVPVLAGQAAAPGLPFFHQLQWMQADDPASSDSLARLIAGIEQTDAQEPKELWRLVDPYRGLKALREEDAALLFGRERLVGQFVDKLAITSPKVIVAVGNSGVGKSSLLFAGVFAALGKGGWPQPYDGEWPANLADSRRWFRISMSPREDPVKELARAFIGPWLDPRTPAYHEEVDAWRARLFKSDSGLDELMIAADRWASDAGGGPPAKYVLYVDQGEELYARAESASAQRFSHLLAAATHIPRLRMLMSLRADFYAEFQEDQKLFSCSERIDVAKLDRDGVDAVVRRPAVMFGARFENGLAETLIEATLRQPMGLPLLSYQMDEIWRAMVAKGDGELRWPQRGAASFNIASALINCADRYLETFPDRAAIVRRLFCVRLIYVPVHGAPTRKGALRSDLTAEEQEVAADLAGAEYRLLSAGENDRGEPTIEIGHETLVIAWNTLSDWIGERRAFYSWLSLVSDMRTDWAEVGRPANGLLSGRLLDRAKANLQAFPEDVGKAEVDFISLSESERVAAEARRQAELEELAEARKLQQENRHLRADAEAKSVQREVASAGLLDKWQNDARQYRYRAFLTYSHRDLAKAQTLHAQLERFRVPKSVSRLMPPGTRLPDRLGPIFRDREDLAASADLGTAISDALRNSAWLIVVCSPSAANSRWVDAEVDAFVRQGKADRILPVIVDGEPHARDNAQECFPPALMGELDYLAIDAREGLKRDVILRIAASMLSISMSDLVRREHRADVATRFGWAAAVGAVAAALAGGFALGASPLGRDVAHEVTRLFHQTR